jgi:ABC-type Fe3+/spermidine/putrescine transport system ATPase subunit
MKVDQTVSKPQTDSVPLLIARGIEKAFERTRALAGAELDIYPGEVMGLLGANGAGKSTLSKVISGHLTRDAGSIALQDKPLNLRSAREAIQHGITMVMQETSLAPDLSVLENVFLAELGRPGFLSYRRLKQRAAEILERLGQRETLPLDREVRLLSAAQPSGPRFPRGRHANDRRHSNSKGSQRQITRVCSRSGKSTRHAFAFRSERTRPRHGLDWSHS